MDRKLIVIDGSYFGDLEGFYREFGRVLIGECCEMIYNLDSLRDVLRGGFGSRGYMEPITLIWKHAHKSKEDLGYVATTCYYRNRLVTCHQTNKERTEILLHRAEKGEGETLFDIILSIIREQSGIELILE